MHSLEIYIKDKTLKEIIPLLQKGVKGQNTDLKKYYQHIFLLLDPPSLFLYTK